MKENKNSINKKFVSNFIYSFFKYKIKHVRVKDKKKIQIYLI